MRERNATPRGSGPGSFRDHIRQFSVWLLALGLLSAGCSDSAPSTTSAPITTTSTASTTTALPTTTTLAPTTSLTTVETTTTEPATTTTSAPTTTTTSATLAPAELVWQAATDKPRVALTFDAGSDRGYAEEILDLLDQQGIRVTFGMTGKWAEANPDLVVRMIDEGHTLMNHTYDHPHMETLTTAERLEQLARTESIINDLTGTSTKPFFRPPYGAYNNQVLVDVGSAGYRYSVMWTVDSLGWKGLPAEEVTARCIDGAQSGAILLLHVGAASTDYAALIDIIAGLSAAGYQFATIQELIP